MGARSGRRSVVRWVGIGMVLAGLGLLGYVGWQYWGTNWVSQRAQERIVDDVLGDWDRPPGTGSGTVRDAGSVQVPEGEVTALIRVPRFGADYVVPVLAGTSDEVLAAGYGHFDNSARPGKVGNYAVAAHRVTHGEPLRDMPSLEIGDEVIVETRAATYTYELTSGGDDLEVPFTETWVVDPLPDNPDAGEPEPAQEPGQRLLTLTTCAELFHTDNRLIAFGVLTDRTPRTGSGSGQAAD
ncbi:class E sortase [Nocardioides donggukensis]|uniref:class E sortase n=1 Tax=Nocardioides donggukensis TaxID=2774019 RepID=UPI00191CDAE6|nr:class E sortase [Nocardioides donggukensis]